MEVGLMALVMAKKPYTTDCRHCGKKFTYDRKVQSKGRFIGKWHGRARHTCSAVCQKMRTAKKQIERKQRISEEIANVNAHIRKSDDVLETVFNMLGIPVRPTYRWNELITVTGCEALRDSIKNMVEPTTEALLWEIAEMIGDYNERPDAKSLLGLTISDSDL